MTLAWLFIPDEWLVVIIVGIGLALIFGIVRAGTAFGLIGVILGMIILGPFIESLMDSLDLWVLLLLLVIGALYVLRVVLSLVLGREGAGSFMGHLAYDLLSLPFGILAGLFRLLVSRRPRGA